MRRRFVIVIAIAALIIGILIGRYAACPDCDEAKAGNSKTSVIYIQDVPKRLVEDAGPEIESFLINRMKEENFRENLKKLTKRPHLGRTEANHELDRKFKAFWEKHGLDHVALVPYQVLLSYPNMSNLNFVELLDENGDTVYRSNLTEPILTPKKNKTGTVPPFNANSSQGDIRGDLVYMNYGRTEDYRYLETHNKSINVTGKIVLVRYGKLFAGNKVKQAEKHGAIGVILYSDPADITTGDDNKVYPDDWRLPSSGAQHGSINNGVCDPLSHGYPETAYRKKKQEELMPGIPCLPIGYGTAIQLMNAMGGDVVDPQWRGKMKTTYRYGNRFKNVGWKARIFVSTKDKLVTTYYAIGVVRGSVEAEPRMADVSTSVQAFKCLYVFHIQCYGIGLVLFFLYVFIMSRLVYAFRCKQHVEESIKIITETSPPINEPPTEVIKVQVYRKAGIGMKDGFVKTLQNHLNSASTTKMQFVERSRAKEIDPNIPTLVLCLTNSRLGSDAVNAVKDISVQANVALVVCYHQEKHALPETPSAQRLTEARFDHIGGIYDLAFTTDKGLYDCEMNVRAKKDIVKFVSDIWAKDGIVKFVVNNP